MNDCNRECLVGIMDGYMNAIYKHDPKAVPPLAIDVRMTENTGRMDVGEACCGAPKWKPRRSRFTWPLNHFPVMCWTDFSFSRQISSASSVST